MLFLHVYRNDHLDVITVMLFLDLVLQGLVIVTVVVNFQMARENIKSR